MSIELPEAHILATQMNRELKGKQVAAIEIKNCEKLQKIGCFNRNASDYNHLAGSKIDSVFSRGLVIRIKLDGKQNLLLAPEYGGRVIYHPNSEGIPNKYHLKVDFTDKSAFTVTLTGLGGVQAFTDDGLNGSYVFRRDFSAVPSPLNDEEFTFEGFAKGLASKNVNIKAVLVGKDALMVGFSNSAFQDIIFRAGIHPKRKASDLSEKEQHSLYDSVKAFVNERIGAGGKNLFVDFCGKPGAYEPLMGPNLKGHPCKKCGSMVDAVGLGGGQVFFCPNCQAT